MSQIPTTTRAVAYHRSLGIDDPQSLIDVELPVAPPGSRDLLVQVEAVAVNPVDYKIRRSADPGGTPRVLGWDAAGTVVAVGVDVELFEVGDEVYYAGALDRPGANSQYHAVDERLAARKPTSLSFTQAAALPLTALTAWEGLFERLALTGSIQETDRHEPDRSAPGRPVSDAQPGGILLVTAAAGGVGSIVTQLARALTSLTVVGTASRPESAKFARDMGAHHIVDHHKPLAPQLARWRRTGWTTSSAPSARSATCAPTPPPSNRSAGSWPSTISTPRRSAR